MANDARKLAVWNSPSYSESRSSGSQWSVRLPTFDLVEQRTTVYLGQAQYLVRAYIQLEAPAAIFPFEIAQVVAVGEPQFKRRFPAGSVKLFRASVDRNFQAIDACIKKWAACYITDLLNAPAAGDGTTVQGAHP